MLRAIVFRHTFSHPRPRQDNACLLLNPSIPSAAFLSLLPSLSKSPSSRLGAGVKIPPWIRRGESQSAPACAEGTLGPLCSRKSEPERLKH